MPAAPQNFAFQEERILLGCTALKWSCINLRTGEVLIEESVGYTKDKGVYRCPPKGNKPRTVSISKRTMQMQFVWKEDQKKRGIVSQYVFTRSDGPEIMFPTTPTKHLKEIGKRCGIEDLHPHKLRHTFASVNLLEGIGDIETIAEILGHSDVSTTLKVYTHASEESKRKMSQSFHDTINKKL